jgi:predicted HTH transcriptional regulator
MDKSINKEEVLNYVRSTGYKTESELRDQFKDQNLEIMGGILEYYVSYGLLRKIEYKSTAGNGVIYIAI